MTGIKILGVGSAIVPLWIPKITTVHRFIGALWNKILMVTCLPLFISGFYVLLYYDWKPVETEYGTIVGYIVGLGLGLLFHELSHAFSAIGYSSRNLFFEMGIMLYKFFPGAYVMIDYSEMRNRFKRAQIMAAGIECNMALCGICFFCLRFAVIDSTALIIAGFINLILTIFNSSMLDGIDGMGIFMEIFGNSNDFMDRAKKLIFDKNSKTLLRNRGINGKATIVACYILVFMQILLPVILIMNAISLLSMVFV